MTQEEIKEEYRKCMESFEYWRDHYLLYKRTVDDFDKSLKETSKGMYNF